MNRDSGLTVLIVVLLGAILGITIFSFASQDDAPEDGRKVLCTGIIKNTENPAREDPLVLKLCADVGVFP